jgi:hypothetical protein
MPGFEASMQRPFFLQELVKLHNRRGQRLRGVEGKENNIEKIALIY